MIDGSGLANALLGLDGFRVLAVTETELEVVIGGTSRSTRTSSISTTDPRRRSADRSLR